MGEVEEVGDGAEEGDKDAEFEVDVEAGRAADGGEVKVEGVEEEGNNAGDEEDAVPSEDNLTAGVKDLVGQLLEGRGGAPEGAVYHRCREIATLHLPWGR